jgi:hypothetical protein
LESKIYLLRGGSIGSRAYFEILPDFISTYAGDTLWALMVFLVIGLIFPSLRLGLMRFVNIVLVLGHGFLWSDLVCYSVGVAMGVVGEMSFLVETRQRPLDAGASRLRSHAGAWER